MYICCLISIENKVFSSFYNKLLNLFMFINYNNKVNLEFSIPFLLNKLFMSILIIILSYTKTKF